MDGETLTLELDKAGFAVASGSACSASSEHPSHVLAAMGALTHGNVRIGLTWPTTAAEIDRFLAALPPIVAGSARRWARRERGRVIVRGVVAGLSRMKCPRPIIEVARRIGEVSVGSLLELLADDPAAGPDLAAWCRMRGQTLLVSDAPRFIVRRES